MTRLLLRSLIPLIYRCSSGLVVFETLSFVTVVPFFSLFPFDVSCIIVVTLSFATVVNFVSFDVSCNNNNIIIITYRI